MDNAAVPIGGEAFAALTVLFVLGMLLIALWRAIAKSRSARGASRGRRAQDGGAYPFIAEGGSRKTDPEASHGGSDGDGGGGDGGGGGD